MLYIKEVNKKHKEVKVIYSLERPDIEFIFGFEIIKNSIKKGHQYKTVFEENGKLIEGAHISITNGFLHTDKNEEIKDNLNELPTF